MAAGNNWKRPWENEARRGPQVARSPPHRPDLPSTPIDAATVALSRPPQYNYSRWGSESKVPTSAADITTMAASSVMSPSPHRHMEFMGKPIEQAQSHWRSSESPFQSHKRQRLEADHLPTDSTLPSSSAGSENASNTSFEDYRSLPQHQIRENAFSSNAPSASRFTGEGSQTPTARHLRASSDQSESSGQVKATCRTCENLHGLVNSIVTELHQLQTEISGVIWKQVKPEHGIYMDQKVEKQAPNVLQAGLQRSLEWILEILNDCCRIARDTINPPNAPPRNRQGFPQYEESLPSAGLVEEREGRWNRPNIMAGIQAVRGTPPPSDDGSRIPEPSEPSTPLYHRRKSGREFHPPSSIISPHPKASMSNSVNNQPESPMQGLPSHRHLPSPSSTSMNFSTASNILPPMSPSALLSKSPHTAHLQELQHQLSTKSLAHQILQQEHDKLLAAFSRSQIRCATLEKKSQVSDREINELSDERKSLQDQINMYEGQMHELQTSRDEACKQSALNGAQYMQIMNMSSRLQAQAARDLKKWKEDREAWENEKRVLLDRLETYEGKRDPESKVEPESQIGVIASEVTTMGSTPYPSITTPSPQIMSGSSYPAPPMNSVQASQQDASFPSQYCYKPPPPPDSNLAPPSSQQPPVYASSKTVSSQFIFQQPPPPNHSNPQSEISPPSPSPHHTHVADPHRPPSSPFNYLHTTSPKESSKYENQSLQSFTSVSTMQAEIARLRKHILKLEGALGSLRGESEIIDVVVERLAVVGRRIRGLAVDEL